MILVMEKLAPDISIHAPVKGATTDALAGQGLWLFQSTLP